MDSSFLCFLCFLCLFCLNDFLTFKYHRLSQWSRGINTKWSSDFLLIISNNLSNKLKITLFNGNQIAIKCQPQNYITNKFTWDLIYHKETFSSWYSFPSFPSFLVDFDVNTWWWWCWCGLFVDDAELICASLRTQSQTRLPIFYLSTIMFLNVLSDVHCLMYTV